MKLIDKVSWPIVASVHVLHKAFPQGIRVRVSRRSLHIVTGGVVMMIGTWLVKNAPEGSSLWCCSCEAFGFTVHGLGAAPLIKVVCEVLKIEA